MESRASNWDEWRELVLAKLKEHTDAQASTNHTLHQLDKRLSAIELRAGFIGATAGAAAYLVPVVLKLLGKG